MPDADVLTVFYEDESLLVVSKPAGIPSQGMRSAVDFALDRAPGIARVPSRNPHAPGEHGLVHRLDVETSGLLVFAKTARALEALVTDWTTGRIVKVYQAWVGRAADNASLPDRIEFPIAHHPKSARRMVALTSPHHRHRGRPQPAVTKILGSSERDGSESTVLEVSVQIQTGVRHQIRCHLAAAGFPILGDRIYAPPGPVRDACPRLALHAARLEFEHPARPGLYLIMENERELPR